MTPDEIMKQAEKLAQFVRSLPDFKIYDDIDGNYNHIGATVADAVLQANMKYESHVRPRINRIRERYPDARTTSSVLHILQSIRATEFLSWRGVDRAERFCQILNLIHAEGIETEADLKEWLSNQSSLDKLDRINGVGPKTIHYLKILVGFPESAIDRRLNKFLDWGDVPPRSYDDAHDIINKTADILGVDRARFDHSIWRFMGKRGNGKECDGPTGIP